MSIALMPLCSVPKVAIRDGFTGRFASLWLPFYGRWYASGQQYAFPASNVPQNRQLTMGGTAKPDTFKKDCCHCA